VGILGVVKVVIHDRTEELPPQLRDYAERKLARLNRHFDRVMLAEVEFDQERKRSTEPARVVRILVRLASRKAPTLKAEEAGPDVQATLDLALDKIDRQIMKLKEKVQGKSRAAAGRVAPAPATDQHADEPERVTMPLRAESVSQAERALESNGHLFHVFLNESSGDVNVIYRRGDGKLVVIEPVVT
jgi:putative sigma-54 modulation protein